MSPHRGVCPSSPVGTLGVRVCSGRTAGRTPRGLRRGPHAGCFCVFSAQECPGLLPCGKRGRLGKAEGQWAWGPGPIPGFPHTCDAEPVTPSRAAWSSLPPRAGATGFVSQPRFSTTHLLHFRPLPSLRTSHGPWTGVVGDTLLPLRSSRSQAGPQAAGGGPDLCPQPPLQLLQATPVCPGCGPGRPGGRAPPAPALADQQTRQHSRFRPLPRPR